MDQARAMDQLRKDARVLKVARMLPAKGKLTDQQITDVRQLVAEYTYRHNISQAQIGKEVGVSSSVISQWHAGKYPGDVDNVTRILNNWIERDAAKRHGTTAVGYVRTQVADDMRNIAHYACKSCRMAAIVCPSGVGKTFVLEALANEMRGFYLYCDEDLTPLAFLQKVARLIGVREVKLQKSIAKDQIIAALRDTSRPLLLDEAHRLPREIFPRLRSIYDQAHVAIIMAGTYEILDRVNDQANARGQLARRCLRYNIMDHIDTGSTRRGRSLFSRDEVQEFFAQGKVRVDPEAFELLHAIACLPGHGCIGTVLSIVDMLTSADRNTLITRASVISALELQVGLAGRSIVRAADQQAALMREVA